MKNLNAIKVGKVVNASYDGVFYTKRFDNNEEALEFYKKIVELKNNFNGETIKNNLVGLFNKTKRILLESGLEFEELNNQYFLKGYNTPIPQSIVDVIIEYHDNNLPLDPILNFWELLMINMDTEVHKDLFDYLSHYNLMINDDGYFVGYKAVIKDEVVVEEFTDIVDDVNFDIVKCGYDKIKRWKKSPKKYNVYEQNDTYIIISEDKDSSECTNYLGTLEDVYNDMIKNSKVKVKRKTYSDKHTGTMEIKLGVPVTEKRELCDNNPRIRCSKGLHIGTPNYAENFADDGDAILICLVNPMNVVAVPNYYTEKLRCCEYIPIAEAEFVDEKLKPIEGSYIDYVNKTHEIEQIKKMAENLKKNQKPFNEKRDINELKKMYENRLFKLTNS